MPRSITLLASAARATATLTAACGGAAAPKPASTPAAQAATGTARPATTASVAAPANAGPANDAATTGNPPGVPPLSGAVQRTPSSLGYIDEVVGTGATPAAGQAVSAHYTGWLTTGQKFDSSRDRGQPFSFTLGRGQVIAGWDEGIAGMKVGGKRRLIVPPALGYGARGAGASVPPNATLIFDVELLGVR